MNIRLKALSAGVAIVVALAVAITFLPGPDADPLPDPTPTSLYRSEPDLLPSGAYVIDKLFEHPITLELPANWTGLEHSRGQALIIKTVDGEPFGTVASTVLLGIYAPDRVYADPCRDRAPSTGEPATFVGIVAGLTHAVGVEAGPLEDTTLGGRPAKVFDLRNTIDMDQCRSKPFNQWSFRDESGVGRGNGTSSGGAHQRVWIVDVEGTVILIDADSGDDSFTEDVEELYQIVESIQFE